MNPYEILGIKEGASQNEIKAAYREQVKKYHPDKHHDNPLNELAEEKMQEINEAYDMLMGGAPGSTGSAGGPTGAYNRNNPGLYNVRKAIDSGNIAQAEQMLNASNDRGAEWHFLYGMAYARKGWYDQAMEFLQKSVEMDPDNMEYRSAMNRIMDVRNPYNAQSRNMGYGSNTDDAICKCCTAYCVADLCCDCI